jgi:DNA-binding NtrC family response regulator
MIRVNVRIISASNKDLRRLVEANEFREDLYYRLKVLTIRVPPLRRRKEDIPVLVEHFLRIHTPAGRRPKTLGEGVLDRMLAYDWPGNVRELENEVKMIIALGEDVVTPDVLSETVRFGPAGVAAVSTGDGPVQNLNDLVERVERAEIDKALRRSSGNKTHASDLLGISRFTLQRKLEKYGLESQGTSG